MSHPSVHSPRIYVALSRRQAKLCSPCLEAVLDAVSVLPECATQNLEKAIPGTPEGTVPVHLVEDLGALVESGDIPAASQFPRKISMAARGDVEVRLWCEWDLRLRLSRHRKEFQGGESSSKVTWRCLFNT